MAIATSARKELAVIMQIVMENQDGGFMEMESLSFQSIAGRIRLGNTIERPNGNKNHFMYVYFDWRNNKVATFETDKELGDFQREDYLFCKAIKEEEIDNFTCDYWMLPFYHPYWKIEVRKGQIERINYLKNKIAEMESDPRTAYKHAKELENFRKELKSAME